MRFGHVERAACLAIEAGENEIDDAIADEHRVAVDINKRVLRQCDFLRDHNYGLLRLGESIRHLLEHLFLILERDDGTVTRVAALIFAIVLLLIQVGLFVAVVLFLYQISAWISSGRFSAPFIPTPARHASVVSRALEISPGDVVYELGCGDGKFMLALAARAPEATFVGVERNAFLYCAALVRKRLAGNQKNATFQCGDFFTIDLLRANKLYAYLLDSAMDQLQPKLMREFKGRVASRAFPFPRKEASHVVTLTERVGLHGQHVLFVYDFN